MPSTSPNGATDRESGPPSLPDTVRSIYLEDATGALEMHQSGESRRLHFVGGELFLTENHPLTRHVGRFLDSGSSAVTLPPKARAELRQLLARIAAFLVKLTPGDFQFLPGTEAGGSLIGPLPTADLVMELAVSGCDEEDLLAQLGSEGGFWKVREDAQNRPAAAWVTADEAFFLASMEQPVSVSRLTKQLGKDRRTVLSTLVRLRAVDLIRQVDPRETGVLQPIPPRGGRVAEGILKRFRERVAEELKAHPVALEDGPHRELLAESLTRLGEVNHYELLEVTPSASVEEIYDAYNRLARLVHPEHAERLALGGKEEVLELLFERATEAYVTLSDPSRRSKYDLDNAIDATFANPPEDTLQLEAQDLAWEYYRRARKAMSEEKYQDSLTLLLEAVRLDPQADYYGLLARVQAKNPNWLAQAVDSYRKALDMDPASVEHRIGLAALCEELERLSEARLSYEDVLDRAPGHPEATEGLHRLDVKEGKVRTRKPGFIRRLLGFK